MTVAEGTLVPKFAFRLLGRPGCPPVRDAPKAVGAEYPEILATS
jgi:hypothetical protein